MSLTTTCKCCCGWWDFDSQNPDMSSISYTANVLVDLVLQNKPLCSIGFGIWGYRITDMTSVGGAVDEIVWTGPYLDPAHPYFGAPSGCTVTFYYSYQGTVVFQVVGQNIYVGSAPVGSGIDWINSLTPPRWYGSGIVIPEFEMTDRGAQQVAEHGFYTQWDLPTDTIPPSIFPMKQDSSVYAEYRGWTYDGPIDRSTTTQDINIESAMIGPISGVTDSAIVSGGGPWVYPETYFYASGGTNTAGSPL